MRFLQPRTSSLSHLPPTRPLPCPPVCQTLLGWEVRLQRSRVHVGTVTEVLFGGRASDGHAGGAEDGGADASRSVPSAGSRVEGAKQGASTRIRRDGGNKCPGRQHLGGSPGSEGGLHACPDLPAGVLLRVQRKATLEVPKFEVRGRAWT